MCSVSAGRRGICKECGKEFFRKDWRVGPERRETNEYCGVKCSAVARRRREMAERRPAVKCCWCSIEYVPTASQSRRKTLLCSRECSDAYRADVRAKKAASIAAALASVKCVDCGTQLKTATSKRCHACVGKNNIGRTNQRMFEKECVRCGETYKATKRKRQEMCNRCIKRTGKMDGTHRARCRQKRLPYDSSVTLQSVRDRCCGVCFWCGCDTLKFYRTFIVNGSSGPARYVDDMSPTVDHVVPLLGKGNTTHGHTVSNTVLSCAGCNTAKGSKVVRVGLISSADPVQFCIDNELCCTFHRRPLLAGSAST